MPAFAAARFLACAPLGIGPAPVACTVRAGGESLRCLRYEARRPVANVLVLHGLSLQGIHDVRMDRVCRALAASGCRVWAPELPDAAALRVTLADRDRVSALLDRFSELAPGVFAPSFSAALALRCAAGRRDVPALCLVGGGADVLRTVRHALEAPGGDPYGRMLLFRNFAPRALGWGTELVEAFDAWLADASLRRAPRFLQARSRLGDVDRDTFDVVLRGEPSIARLGGAVLADASGVLHGLDALPHASRVHAKVVLLHGPDDRVIPASESIELARRLPAARLCLTPLLDHGDTRISLRGLASLPGLHGALTQWFAALGAAVATA